TSTAIVGAALGGLSPRSAAAPRRPGRSGTLQFGPLLDTSGLDSHRHNQLHTSNPTAAMYTGLTDLDHEGNIVPGIAESWEPNQALTSWVFRLRKGVLFHNGREVDAEAVKLNLLRIKDPAIGTDWHRGVVENIETVDVVDKYTVRLHTRLPDVAVPANVVFYPTNLIAPESFYSASEHPIGTGPFKFVSCTRWNQTRLARLETYWEPDAEGNHLPYLDEIIGRPKKEDSVRLTALRTGQVHLIDNMAYADVERFKKSYGDKYHLWQWHFGGIFVVFNFRRGPFHDQPLPTPAAHAINRQAVHTAVFYGQGTCSTSPIRMVIPGTW